jgi:hypothetical protein
VKEFGDGNGYSATIARTRGEQVRDRPIFVRCPEGTRLHEAVAVEQVHLERQDGEEEVAVGVHEGASRMQA